MGFRYVASGPLVRSSYKAGEFFIETMLRADEQSKLSSKSVTSVKSESETKSETTSSSESVTYRF